MKLVDDRTPRERYTHNILVAGIDTFLSGWGEAKKVKSVCAWACKSEDVDKVLKWAKSRGDLKLVKVKSGDYKPIASHFRIYVVDHGHPAIND